MPRPRNIHNPALASATILSVPPRPASVRFRGGSASGLAIDPPRRTGVGRNDRRWLAKFIYLDCADSEDVNLVGVPLPRRPCKLPKAQRVTACIYPARS